MKGFIINLSMTLLLITGCGGSGSDKGSDTHANANTAPLLTTDKSIQITEGQRNIVTLEATDKESDPLEFTLIDSADKSHFTLGGQGQLAFKNIPDYESPLDANTDNSYQITVRLSDGQLSSDVNLTVKVINALEGRVVDGPLAEAQLFIDCNGNGVRNVNEPLTTTDEDGYYMVAFPENCDYRVLVSSGGRDIATGKETDMVLMAKLPDNYDMSKNIVVTPLSTVLTYSAQEDQKTLLNNLGISSIESSDQLLSLDTWQQTIHSAVSAKAAQSPSGVDTAAIQRVNAQLATLIETVDTFDGDEPNTNVARAISDLSSQQQRAFDLSNAGTLDDILNEVVDQQIPDAVVEAVATINSYLAAAVDPTGDMTINIISNSQQELQDNIVKLLAKEITEEQFIQSNSENITTIIKAPIASPSKVETVEGIATTISLQGIDSDGNSAKDFTIQELPNHGSLIDPDKKVVIHSEDLPYRLSNNLISYRSESKASNDSFVFTVRDSESAIQSAPAVVAIKISGINDRPVALDRIVTLKEGASTQTELMGTDKDGDTLSYKIIELPKFGKLMDGDKQIQITDLSYLLLESGNSIIYESTSSTATIDSFYYVANDGQINSKRAKVTLNIEGVNQIPVIEGQQALSILEDESLEITLAHLKVNDNDNIYPDDFTLELSSGTNYLIEGNKILPKVNYEGDLAVPVTVNDGAHNSELFELTVSVTAVDDPPTLDAINTMAMVEDQQSPATLELQGADIDSKDLEYAISGGSDSTVKASLSGQTVTFETAQDFNGSVQFTATVAADGKTASQVFTVTVSPQNDLPTISGNLKTSLEQGEDYALIPKAEDRDGDPLIFSINTTPSWANFDPKTGALTGKPGNEHVGVTQGIQISVTDNIGSKVSLAAFDLEVINVNDAPQVVSQKGSAQTLTIEEDSSLLLTLNHFVVSDIDNALSDLSLEVLPGANYSVKGTEVVPTKDYNGELEVQVRIDDGVDQSAQYPVKVVVSAIDDAPTLDAINTMAMVEDQQSPATLELQGADIDSKDLEYAISGGSDSTVKASLSGQTVTFETAQDFNGSVQFTATVAADGKTASQAFTVTVSPQNDLPTISGNLKTSLEQGEDYALIPKAEDRDGDPLIFSINTTPSWANFDPKTGALTGKPGNEHVGVTQGIQISVTDNIGSKVSLAAFDLEVINVNDAPQVVSQKGSAQTLTIEEDSSLLLTLNHFVVSDIDNALSDLSLEVLPGANYSVKGTEVVPTKDYNGELEVQVRIDDGVDQSAQYPVKVVVSAIDDAPTLDAINTMAMVEDQQSPATLELQGADIDSKDLEYAISGGSDSTVKASLSGQTVTFETAQDFNGSVQFTATVAADGKTASQAFTVTVSPQNDLPTISGNLKTSLEQGEDYALIPKAEDRDGDPLIFSINTTPSWANFDPKTGALTGKPGNEHVGVTQGIQISVTDNIGSKVSLAAFDLEVINVNDAPQVVSQKGSAQTLTIEEDSSLLLTLNHFVVSDIDNALSDLSLEVLPGANYSVKGTEVVPTKDYNGELEVQVRIDDGVDQSAQYPVKVVVSAIDDAPTLDAINTMAMVEDQQSPATLELQGADIDSKDLEYAISGGSDSTVKASLSGQTVTFETAQDFNGSVQFTATVAADGKTASQAFTVTVSPQNDLPTISGNLKTSLKQGEDYALIPKAEDRDGDPLIFSINTTPSWANFDPKTGALTGKPGNEHVGVTQGIQISVTDNIGSKVSLAAFDLEVINVNDAPQVVSQKGSAQTLTIEEDSSLLLTLNHFVVSDIDNALSDLSLEVLPGANYSVKGTEVVPTKDYNGELEVQVRIDDGVDQSAQYPVKVVVSAIDDAPTLDAINTMAMVEDQQSPATLELQGADIDSKDLEYAISGGSDSTVKASLSGQTVTFETAQDFNGSVQFTATVAADGKTASQAFTVTVSPQNDLPTISGNLKTSLEQGEDYALIPKAEDRDGDPLIFSINTTPSWANFDPKTGALTGKPGNEHVGVTQGIQISVTDNIGSKVSLAAFDLEVINVNDKPILSGIGDISFDEDQYNNENGYILTLQGTDIDNDNTLTFNIEGGSEDTVKIKPLSSSPMIGYLSTQQKFAISSAEDFFDGQGIAFTATVTDSGNPQKSSSPQTFFVTVNSVNDAPIIAKDANLNAVEGQLFSFTPTVNDPDDENEKGELTWELSAAPGDMSLVNNRGVVEWTPGDDVDDSVTFTLSVQDGREDGAAPAERTFTVSVDQQPDGGEVSINGNVVVGQILTAVVTDDDGDENLDIDYKWQRVRNYTGTRAEDIESVGNDVNYLITADDVGAIIRVTAQYQDNQEFTNSPTTTTESEVVALPTTKKTIVITDANIGMTVFDADELSTQLSIGDISDYTLKELSIERSMEIAHHWLPKQASTASSNRYPVYGYQHIQDMYSLLDDSSVFDISSSSGNITLRDVPLLPKSYVGTGKENTTIGKSHTLAVFDPDNKLAGLVNVRFSPAGIDKKICTSSENTSSEVTQNPVVLVHGWQGFDRAKMIDIDYWNKIVPELTKTGAQVFTTKIDPWTYHEIRGEQLIAYIECVRDLTKEHKVDLIGHSLGSGTARYAAYWLDDQVSSVTGVQGTNQGGNLSLSSTAHLELLLEKAAFLYQSSILLRDYSINDLLFEFIDRDDLQNSQSDLGKQYQLAINILEELTKDGGMLDATVTTLSDTQRIMDSLIGVNDGVITKWLNVETSIRDWEQAGLFLSCSFDWFNLWDFRTTWENCLDDNNKSDLGVVIDNFYSALKKINIGTTTVNSKLVIISPQIKSIKESLGSIKDELEKLSYDTENPDYYRLVLEMDKVDQAVSTIVSNLSNLKDALEDNFIPGLKELESALQDYDDLLDSQWHSLGTSWFADWIIDGLFLGLNKDEVAKLKEVVAAFSSLLDVYLSPLIETSSSVIVTALIKFLSSGDINDVANIIATLIDNSVSFLESFEDVVIDNTATLNVLTPRWGGYFGLGISTPLSPLSVELDKTRKSMPEITDSIGLISDAMKVALGSSYNASWSELLKLEFEQIKNIENAMVGSFFAKLELGQSEREKVVACIKDENGLQNYLRTQYQNKDDTNNFIPLPGESDLSKECAGAFSNIIVKLVNHFVSVPLPVPMDASYEDNSTINPETGKSGWTEVKEGIYTVGSFSSQLFNLKYPDTGILPGRYEACLNEDDPDFSLTQNYNENRTTKYYSIIGNRTRKEENIIDRVALNMMTSANNSDPQDRYTNVIEFVSGVTMIDRPVYLNDSESGLEGEQNNDEIVNLFNNTDLLVEVCSQELGEVVLFSDGAFTVDLNHAQGINNSFILGGVMHIEQLVDLLLGKDVDGYQSISPDMQGCNDSSTVMARKTCLVELLPRVMTMYATGTAIRGLNDNSRNGSIDIFDLIKAVLQEDVDIEGVPNPSDAKDKNYVPLLYNQHLQNVQSNR